MNKASTVEEYIKSAPIEVQERLNVLRKTIKDLVPEADESVSYGIAAYKYNGKPLVYFGFAKKHIGLYAIPSNIEAHKEELKKYKTSKGTIQLPLSEKLPIPLIKKLVKARLKIIS